MNNSAWPMYYFHTHTHTHAPKSKQKNQKKNPLFFKSIRKIDIIHKNKSKIRKDKLTNIILKVLAI